MSLSVFDIASSRLALGRSSFFVMGPVAEREKIEKSAERSVLAELRSNMGSWTGVEQ